MINLLKRILGRGHASGPPESGPPTAYRFEMCQSAAEIINEFSEKLVQIEPPEIPTDIAPVRGWSIRLEGLSEYIHLIQSEPLRALFHQLDYGFSRIERYLIRWQSRVENIDPLLLDYEILPGEVDAMESIQIIAQRCLNTKNLIHDQLAKRAG